MSAETTVPTIGPRRDHASHVDPAAWNLGNARLCGIDEVGRGPLAGPVHAAAVILPPDGLPAPLAAAVTDSKRLSRAKRERLAPQIAHHCHVGIGVASVEEIERINILQASLLAMARAVAALPVVPDQALVDGRHVPTLPCPARAIIGGDGTVPAIAAASIVAKVTRDHLMARLAQDYPGYGWDRNAGYGTREHLDALHRLGATPHHRCSFAPVRAIVAL